MEVNFEDEMKYETPVDDDETDSVCVIISLLSVSLPRDHSSTSSSTHSLLSSVSATTVSNNVVRECFKNFKWSVVGQ